MTNPARGRGWPGACRKALACGLCMVGGTWTLLSIVDMHVFAVLKVGHGLPGGHLGFHGIGALLVAMGVLTLLGPRRRRSRATEPVLPQSGPDGL